MVKFMGSIYLVVKTAVQMAKKTASNFSSDQKGKKATKKTLFCFKQL